MWFLRLCLVNLLCIQIAFAGSFSCKIQFDILSRNKLAKVHAENKTHELISAKNKVEILLSLKQNLPSLKEASLENLIDKLDGVYRRFKIAKILAKLRDQKPINIKEVDKLSYYLTPMEDPYPGFLRSLFGLNINKELKPILEYRLRQLRLRKELLLHLHENKLLKPPTKYAKWYDRYHAGKNSIKTMIKSLTLIIPVWSWDIDFIKNRNFTEKLLKTFETKGIDEAFDYFKSNFKLIFRTQSFIHIAEKAIFWIFIVVALGLGARSLLEDDDDDDDVNAELKSKLQREQNEFLGQLLDVVYEDEELKSFAQTSAKESVPHMDSLEEIKAMGESNPLVLEHYIQFKSLYNQKNESNFDLSNKQHNALWTKHLEKQLQLDTVKILYEAAIVEKHGSLEKAPKPGSEESIKLFRNYLEHF